MRKELLELLQLLLLNKEPIASKEIAARFNISEKTVLKYLNELKDELSAAGASIKIIQGVGSYIEISDKKKFYDYYEEIKRIESGLNDDPKTRRKNILFMLLVENDYINVYDLADQMYVSPSLIRQEFKAIKSIVEDYHLELIYLHNRGYKIKGDEINIRACLSRECKGVGSFDKLFETDNASNRTDGLYKIIESSLKQFNINVSSQGIHALCLHLLIAINRVETNNTIDITDSYVSGEIISSPEYFVAKYINKQISELYNISLPENELTYFTLHISGKQRLFNHEKIQNNISEDTISFYNHFLGSINRMCDVDLFEDGELRSSLLNHIGPFISRLRNNLQISKSELDNIKGSFPVPYTLARCGLSFITKSGVDITEEETSYFALHIALSLEKRRERDIMYKVCIISTEYSNLNNLLSYKLLKKFPNNIESVDFAAISDISNIDKSTYQLLINITKFPVLTDIECVNVSSAFDYSDLNVIREKIDTLSSKLNSKSLYKRDLFYRINPKNKEEALAEIKGRLVHNANVSNDYIESVKERNKLDSPEYGNGIAILYPLRFAEPEPFVGVFILNKPITWDKEKVSIVFAVGGDHSDTLATIFGQISNLVVNDHGNLNKIITNPTYENFIQIINKI